MHKTFLWSLIFCGVVASAARCHAAQAVPPSGERADAVEAFQLKPGKTVVVTFDEACSGFRFEEGVLDDRQKQQIGEKRSRFDGTSVFNTRNPGLMQEDARAAMNFRMRELTNTGIFSSPKISLEAASIEDSGLFSANVLKISYTERARFDLSLLNVTDLATLSSGKQTLRIERCDSAEFPPLLCLNGRCSAASGELEITNLADAVFALSFRPS